MIYNLSNSKIAVDNKTTQPNLFEKADHLE